MVEVTIEYRLPSGEGRACEGWSYGGGFEEHARLRVRDRCTGGDGTADILQSIQENASEFEYARIEEILAPEPPDEPWKAGECIAECFLEDSKEAVLPNPHRSRNPRASPAGPDLVGFSKENAQTLFLFGEVKTSSEERSPPSVMNRMASQLKGIASSGSKREGLIGWLVRELEPGQGEDLLAALRSYRSGMYRIVGALVRDTKPQESDISTACSKIKRLSGCMLALYALYLPVGVRQAAGIMAERPDG